MLKLNITDVLDVRNKAQCVSVVLYVTIIVTVRRPPVITKGPSGQYVTKIGGTALEIPCEASGSPAPTE
jgi:hypothetical protein